MTPRHRGRQGQFRGHHHRGGPHAHPLQEDGHAPAQFGVEEPGPLLAVIPLQHAVGDILPLAAAVGPLVDDQQAAPVFVQKPQHQCEVQHPPGAIAVAQQHAGPGLRSLQIGAVQPQPVPGADGHGLRMLAVKPVDLPADLRQVVPPGAALQVPLLLLLRQVPAHHGGVEARRRYNAQARCQRPGRGQGRLHGFTLFIGSKRLLCAPPRRGPGPPDAGAVNETGIRW